MYISFIGLSVDLNDEERVIAALVDMEDVIEVYTMMGPFKLFAKVKADTIKKLEATIAEVQGLPGVQRSFNFLAVQQKKG
ncbi:MAG TPA: Lrp/AsnC ligand binding domain-containing protein [Methanocella sp.]|jgi:DNA-binding Lrp family transcriptional regulator